MSDDNSLRKHLRKLGVFAPSLGVLVLEVSIPTTQGNGTLGWAWGTGF